MQEFLGLALDVVLLLIVVGAAVGFVSAFFGVGGCFLMVPAMITVFVSMGIDVGVATKVALGTNMGVVVPTAISGAFRHSREIEYPKQHFVSFAVPVAVGSAIGSVGAFLVPGAILKVLFGVLCVIGAYRFMTAKPKPVDAMPEVDSLKWTAAGVTSGGVAHFLGIGGGLVYMPMLNTVLEVPARKAVSISVGTMVIGSSVGALFFAALGSINPGGVLPPGSIGWFNIPVFIALGISSVIFAQLGGRATHRVSPKRLKILLAIVYIYVGLRLIGILAMLGWPY